MKRWIKTNPNPLGKEAPDCVIRALCIALDCSWYQIYDDLCRLGREECSMPSADAVWGKYLYLKGFTPFQLHRSCPDCITIGEFAERFPEGIYIIGTGSHAVAIMDGRYYDSWDSGNEIASFFWQIT